VTPLRQLEAQQNSADMILYEPQTALRLHYPEEFDKRQPVGENSPAGAIINYYFKVAPKDEVTLDILDTQGKLVRHLSNKEKKENEQPPEWPDRVQAPKTIPANEGMNRFAWDLRCDDPVQIPGAFYSGNGPRGPLALPGDYQLKLTANGKTQTATLHLAIDPRTKGQEAELQKQFALSSAVTERISQLHQTVNGIREVKSQIKTLHEKFGEEPKVKVALESADAMERKMSEIERQLMQVNMKGSEGNLAFPNMLNEAFDSFSHSIDAGDREPTKPQLDVFASLSGRLDEQLKKWNAIKQDDMPKVIAMIKQADLPALVLKEEKSETEKPSTDASGAPGGRPKW
jgi:hypothetical protein